jgi:hypothetical protein
MFEGLDAVGKEALLDDVDVSSLTQPYDSVWLGVWHYQQLHSFDDLGLDQVILTPAINNKMQWGPLYPHP